MILLRLAHLIHSMFEHFIFVNLRKKGLWIPMIRADRSAAKKSGNSVRVMGPRIYGVTEDVIRKLNKLCCFIVMNSERGPKFATHYWHKLFLHIIEKFSKRTKNYKPSIQTNVHYINSHETSSFVFFQFHFFEHKILYLI